MTREEYREYLQTDGWRLRAYAAKWAAGFRCQVCDAAEPLDAHHRHYRTIGNEAPGDLIALCRICHELYEQARLDGDLAQQRAFLQTMAHWRPDEYAQWLGRARQVGIDRRGLIVVFDREDQTIADTLPSSVEWVAMDFWGTTAAVHVYVRL